LNKLSTSFVLLLTFYSSYLFSQPVLKESSETVASDISKLVNPIVRAFESNNKDFIANIIRYPLKRESPIPAIDNKVEMIKRFDEVFDSNFVQTIVNSDSTVDWSKVGWRGVMFMNGDMWLDTDGNIISVNYQSKYEEKNKAQILEKQKGKLHFSIAQFEKPILEWKTKKFRVRIDEMNDGLYRYAVWNVAASISSKPDLIISKGNIDFDGSGGNHSYIFLNGSYTYECAVTVLGTSESPPGMLSVYKGHSLILEQPVIEVIQ